MQEWGREKTHAVTQMQKAFHVLSGPSEDICVCTCIFTLALRVCISVYVCVYAYVCFFYAEMQRISMPWIKLTAWCLEWISGLSVKQLFIHPGWDKQTHIQLNIHTHTFHKPYCAIIKVTGT